MKKLSFFLMAMLFTCSTTLQAAEVTETIAMKGFGGLTTATYENVTQTGTSDLGTEMVAYAFNPSNGQIRGNKTVIAGASVTSTDKNKNWSLYNTQAMPGAIKKITVSQTATGNNKFKGTLFVALGTTNQGDVTTVAGAQENTTGNATEFTFDIDETQGYTYFKLLSNVAFTSGSVAGAVVTVTYVTAEGGEEEVTKYTVTTNVNDPAMGTVSGAGEYAEGKTATLTANANPGYKFVNWSNGSTDNPLKITVTEDVEVTANFEAVPPMTCAEAAATANGTTVVLNPFDVVAVVKDAGYIYIEDESGVNLIYDYNLAKELKAGDHVEGFVGYSSPYNGLPELKTSVAYTDLTVTHGTAPEPTLFTEAPVKADVNKYVKFENVTFTADVTYTAGSTGSNATMVVNGTNVTVRNTFKLAATLSKDKAYNLVGFVAVYNSTIQVYFLSTEEYVAPVVNHTITVSANPAEAGTVTGAGTYEEGATATLTATPAEGYEFVKWTSGETEVSTANPFTFTVTSDTTLVANFKEVVVEPTEVTVYCINSSKWDVVACHHWVEGGSTTAWPGDVMTKTEETVNGFDVYAATFTIEHTYCIFNNNNNGSQTGTLTVENGHYYYVKDAKWYASLADVPALDPLATDVYLAGEMNEWSTVANEFRKATEDATTASLTLTLEAATTYEFKVVKEGIWLGNGGTITASVEGWTFKTDAGNCKLTTDAAGEYVLTWDLNTNKLTVTYPELVPAVYKDITVTIGTAGFTGSTPTIKWWGAKGLANATEPQEMTATGFGGRYSYTFEQVDSVTGVNFYVELGGLRSKTITLHETPASYSQFYNILQNVYVKGGFNDWNDNDQLTKKSQDYKAISGIVQLKADTTYEFKITVNGDWYGNAQAITKDATTAKFADNDKNATITTTLAGGYTFTYNYLDSTLSVVYPVSVALDLGECTPAYNDEGIILESEDGTTVTIYNYQDGEYVHGDEIDVRASIEHNGKGNWDLFDGKGSWQVVNDVQNLVTTTLVNDDKTGYYTITATCALPQKHTLTLTGEYDVEEYGMGSITTFTATTEEDKALVVQITNEEEMSIMGILDDVHMTISETWEVVDGEDDTKTLTFTGTLSNGDTYDITLTATKKVYPTVAIVNAEVTVDGTSLVMTGKLYEQTVTCTIWEYNGEGNYEWLEIVSDDYSIYWGGVTPAELTEDGTNYTLTGVFTDYSEKYNVIFTTKSVATSLDNVEMGTAPVKVIENGQLIIIRDDIKYNVQGAVVK